MEWKDALQYPPPKDRTHILVRSKQCSCPILVFWKARNKSWTISYTDQSFIYNIDYWFDPENIDFPVFNALTKL